ncbi:hypothetical protein D9M71_834090 [compost metagenome]
MPATGRRCQRLSRAWPAPTESLAVGGSPGMGAIRKPFPNEKRPGAEAPGRFSSLGSRTSAHQKMLMGYSTKARTSLPSEL